MGQPIDDGTESFTRQLIRLAEPIHAMTYYRRRSPDSVTMASRVGGTPTSPTGPRPWARSTLRQLFAAFYNFGSPMVERAIPSVWTVMTPADVHQLRLELVDEALRRSLGDLVTSHDLSDTVSIVRKAFDNVDVGARPVFAAYRGLEWPSEPHMALWHGCTLFREHRGDSHHIALAAAEVSGIESHVLMAAFGHGDRDTILPIRGWTETQWQDATANLQSRGWLDTAGHLTGTGRRARSSIEALTDDLANQPLRSLGDSEHDRLLSGLRPFQERLVAGREVATEWPPPWLKQQPTTE